MAGHKITGFLGITPRTAERLLPDMGAQIAENVILTSGEIRPMRPPYQVHIPPALIDIKACYRAYNGVIEKWASWSFDVDVAKAPLSPDVEARYIWTGDGCPRYSTFTGFGYREAVFAGVYTALTTCTCPDKHGLITGNQVLINAVTLTVTVVSEYVFTVPGNYAAYTSFRHVQFNYALGQPNPTARPAASATGGTGSTVNRTYCYTNYQPSTGEESGPSPVALIASGRVDGTWTITNFSAVPTNDRAANYNTSGLKQRLYRTSGTAAGFQLVAERVHATTSWTDNLTDSQILGDELVTSGWEPPPVGLKGVITLPNGANVGFVDNQICYSEPYQPHSWPKLYRYQAESDVVGIAAYGTTVVAATKTRPYVADGVTPDAVTMQSINSIWPCKSKRSVCSAGDGVVYATEAGLAYIGASGPSILTKALMTIEEWRELTPTSMDVKVIDNRVFILFTDEGGATSRLMRIDVGEAAALVSFSGAGNAIYADPLDGYLYLLRKEIYRFDATFGARDVFVWRSKEIELAESINLGAGIIEWQGTMPTTEVQAAYAIFLADQVGNQAAITAGRAVGAFGQSVVNGDPINGASTIVEPREPAERLTYTLLDHDVAVFSTLVQSGVPFRLPAGYKTDVLAHQLVGNVRVKYIKVAESMIGLKAL